jgi:hydroxyacylglutathione hydrolase
LNYRKFVVGSLAVNCYLVWSGRAAGVIDPGGPVAELIHFMQQNNLNLQWIVNTHGHADHILGNGDLQAQYPAPLLIHPADRDMLTAPQANLSVFLGAGFTSPDATDTLQDGQRLFLENEYLTIIETPGHTPGGISLWGTVSGQPDRLFSGDALFLESIGRTDLPGGDAYLLKASIEKLMALDTEYLLCGHPYNHPGVIQGKEAIKANLDFILEYFF